MLHWHYFEFTTLFHHWRLADSIAETKNKNKNPQNTEVLQLALWLPVAYLILFFGQKREPATLVFDIPGSACNIREQGHLSLLYAASPAISLFSTFVTVTLILKSNIRK